MVLEPWLPTQSTETRSVAAGLALVSVSQALTWLCVVQLGGYTTLLRGLQPKSLLKNLLSIGSLDAEPEKRRNISFLNTPNLLFKPQNCGNLRITRSPLPRSRSFQQTLKIRCDLGTL